MYYSMETLLDILVVLYDECCGSSLRREKTVSEFIDLGESSFIHLVFFFMYIPIPLWQWLKMQLGLRNVWPVNRKHWKNVNLSGTYSTWPVFLLPVSRSIFWPDPDSTHTQVLFLKLKQIIKIYWMLLNIWNYMKMLRSHCNSNKSYQIHKIQPIAIKK